MMGDTLTSCQRCERPARGRTGSPDARIMRRAKKGDCAECSIVLFLKKMDIMHGGAFFGTPTDCASRGPSSPHKPADVLRLPHIQEQIGRLLKAGMSDATLGDIDFERVIEVWDIVDDTKEVQKGLF